MPSYGSGELDDAVGADESSNILHLDEEVEEGANNDNKDNTANNN